MFLLSCTQWHLDVFHRYISSTEIVQIAVPIIHCFLNECTNIIYYLLVLCRKKNEDMFFHSGLCKQGWQKAFLSVGLQKWCLFDKYNSKTVLCWIFGCGEVSDCEEWLQRAST